MNWDLVLGAWGAILATVLAIIEVRRHRRDRAELTFTTETFTIPMDPNGDGPDGYRISVTNSGRRPITVAAVGVTTSAPTRFVALSGDSVTLLPEGACHRVEGLLDGLDEVMPPTMTHVDGVVHAWALDTTGRRHLSVKYPFRKR